MNVPCVVLCSDGVSVIGSWGAGLARSMGLVRGAVLCVDGMANDILDVGFVDTENRADMHRPDLGTHVVLEVELATNIGPCGLTVLTDHHERGQEDRFQAHDHRQETKRKLPLCQPRVRWMALPFH